MLGDNARHILAAAELGYFHGYWSSWIVAEFARVRTEWVILRAVKEYSSREEVNRRLRDSRARVNAAITQFSVTLTLVDYLAASEADLSWLRDADDWPIMRAALAAHADTLVTENHHDFPLGEERNGVLLLGSAGFLAALYQKYPHAEAAIAAYLSERG